MSNPITPEREPPAFLFDLDGTLVDSVYHHVLAWNDALQATGLPLSVWRIHRRIGMSGGLFANALQRDLGREIDPNVIVELRKRHKESFNARSASIKPLPGSIELLKTLTELKVKWGHRHQRPYGNGAAEYRDAGRRFRQGARGDARPGPLCQARPRSVPGRGPNVWASISRTAWWSATAYGTCWPPNAPGR